MTTNEKRGLTNDPLAKRVLERIENEHMTPRPRWAFLVENYIFWGFGVFAVALGALAFAAALFEVANAGWSFYLATHPDFTIFFFQAAPFLWVLALALFVGLGYANIRATRRGYRYSLALIALGAVLTSVALGSGLYVLGAGEAIEESIGDHPPFYRPILAQERSWWSRPEQGVLGGAVVSASSSAFVLRDFSGKIWAVDADDLRVLDIAALEVGQAVRVVGTSVSATSSSFHACFVFLWQSSGSPAPASLPFSVASSSERIPARERSEECKGIRPYGALRALHGE